MNYLLLFLLFALFASDVVGRIMYRRQNLLPTNVTGVHYIEKTRSLSGTRATEGNALRNREILGLLTEGLLGRLAIRKVKMYNDREYLNKYRRSYWLGDRYYRLDNRYYLATRDTCAYHMDNFERQGLTYEDDIPITHVIFQCQRYVDYCCGLDCCRDDAPRPDDGMEQIAGPVGNNWRNERPWMNGAMMKLNHHHMIVLLLLLCLICFV